MDIYIDHAFIEEFAAQTAHPLHEKLRNFLKKPKTGKKYINFETVEEFEQAAKDNPLFEMLLESSIPTLAPDFQEEMRKESFYETSQTALFFNEEDDNEQLQEDFGCIFINSATIHKAHFLFNWHLIPFMKPRPTYDNWSFMAQLRHPCNALIVTDNYLFAKEPIVINKLQLDENLLPILYNLMPRRLKIDFHLTIIGSPIDRNGKNQLYIKNFLNEIHEYVVKRLAERFKYRVILSIIIAPFHDRNILTNYAWLNSGNSFTYFDNKRLHSNTNLMFQPVTHANSTYNPFFHSTEQSEENTSVSDVWENIRTNCKNWTCKKPDESSSFKFLSAPCVNRLLS